VAGVPVDSSLVTILTNAGICGVFVLLFLFGYIYPKSVVADLKEENAALKQALDSQRDRADAAVAAATSTKDVMVALQTGMQMAKQQQINQ
jgi:hypothetical protein